MPVVLQMALATTLSNVSSPLSKVPLATHLRLSISHRSSTRPTPQLLSIDIMPPSSAFLLSRLWILSDIQIERERLSIAPGCMSVLDPAQHSTSDKGGEEGEPALAGAYYTKNKRSDDVRSAASQTRDMAQCGREYSTPCV
ncbi:hypothetical protein BD311DRAFT_770047 [Dichomitus squalens]|uniref:Uncharacterized protein n=1 Tax=Dichomitus squalens TaxID=114155 RepID=A0A4Q9MA76_9APHY|nr:hypothetical protein BD311DRAFT_770047 [Dichomitus squalens]